MKLPEKPPPANFEEDDKTLVALLNRSQFDLTLKALIDKIQTEYLPWEKVKYLKTNSIVKPETLWRTVKFLRDGNSQPLHFGPYIFNYSINSSLLQTLHEFDMHYGGSLISNNPLTYQDRQQYLISSVMEEAISSSQIEGAITTRVAAKEMLKRNQKPRNKSEMMIVNNYQTIQYIRTRIEDDLTVETLLEIQALMTKDTLDNPADEGRLRVTDDVRVVDVTDGEVMHQPPSVIELEKLVNGLCYFFNSDSALIFIHPVVKASIIHFLVGYIHPFADGNGRTARALFYWYLLKKGYWLTEYLSISSVILETRTQYSKAFLYTETDNNDLTYFIQYKLKILQRAYDNLKHYLKRKQDERQAASVFLKVGGINERQAQLLQELISDPGKILTVREQEIRFQVANQTARNDLQGLEKMGYLRSSFINKKKQVYSRSEDFNQKVHVVNQ